MTRCACLFISLIMLALTASAAAGAAPQPDVVLRAEQFGARKLELRVEPLTFAGGAAAETGAALVGRVIVADLLHSGCCRVLGPLAPAAHESLGVSFVVTGELAGAPPARGAGAAPALTLRLQTFPGGELVLGKRYAPDRDQLRATAHHFVNEIVQLLTGESGISLSRIVFSRGAGGRRDLWVVDYDGENPTRLTANRTLNLCPNWSPDGQRIAFTSYAAGQQGVYMLETASGKVRRVIATEGLNLGPAWHPGGGELLLSLSKDGDPEIYRVDLAGRVVRRLTVSPAIEISPAWSPNGRDIVFTSDRTGSPQLYVMDGDGAGRNRLTFEGDYNDSGVWSPNGERIAYVTRVGSRTFLVLISATGENRRLLTDESWRHAEDPSWAPDGRHLVFASDRTGVSKLYVLDCVDGTWWPLTFGDEPDITPAWSH